MRESQALQDQDFKPPTQKITDPTELAEYRLRKRKEFEDLVRRVRWNQSVWVKVRTALLLQLATGLPAVPPHCAGEPRVVKRMYMYQQIAHTIAPANCHPPRFIHGACNERCVFENFPVQREGKLN